LLTTEGRELIQKVESARRRWADSLLGNLSSQDRRMLRQGLKRFPGNTVNELVKQSEPRTSEGVELSQDLWPDHSVVIGHDPSSPRVALEKMLSTLGLVGRFDEGME
jgi:hypothetical protein